MVDWWGSITEGQGTVISGALTIAAALFGVLLGGKIFGGKVKDLETALSATENAIEQHSQRVSQRLLTFDENFTSIMERLSTLEEQFAATTESLGQLRGSVGDLQNSADQAEDAEVEDAVIFTRDQVREDWNAVRDLLEQKAADPTIDGRTRAKYARLDRRSYNYLIDILDRDGNLSDAQQYRQANEIWQQHRNRRREVDQTQAGRLRQIRLELLGG